MQPPIQHTQPSRSLATRLVALAAAAPWRRSACLATLALALTQAASALIIIQNDFTGITATGNVFNLPAWTSDPSGAYATSTTATLQAKRMDNNGEQVRSVDTPGLAAGYLSVGSQNATESWAITISFTATQNISATSLDIPWACSGGSAAPGFGFALYSGSAPTGNINSVPFGGGTGALGYKTTSGAPLPPGVQPSGSGTLPSTMTGNVTPVAASNLAVPQAMTLTLDVPVPLVAGNTYSLRVGVFECNNGSYNPNIYLDRVTLNGAVAVSKSSNKDILTFGSNIAFSSATIDTGAGTVAMTVPFSTNVTTLAPAYTVSPLAAGDATYPSGSARDFTTPQTYTITAEDLSTKVYTVTVSKTAASSAKDILTFGMTNYPAVISGTNISWIVPATTNLATLAPTYTISGLASGSPLSNSAPGFVANTPTTYTITAEDGSTQDYLVTVVPTAPSGKVYVNIDNSARSGLVGPAGGLGETWNQKLGDPAARTASNLRDSAGVLSTVGYTASGSIDGLDTWASPSLTLLSGGLRAFDTSAANQEHLLITNLATDHSYHLYIASANCDANQKSDGVFATTNISSTIGSQTCDNSTGVNGSTWVRGNNFVLFENVQPDVSGHLTVNWQGVGGYRSPLSGFQLLDRGLTTGLSALSASQSIAAGTATLALSGTVSTPGALYPAIGETVHVTINGTTQDTTVSGSAGQFTLSFDTSALAFGGPYTIRYAYDGSATLAGSADETTALTVIAGMSPFQAWIAGLDWSGFTSPDLTASGDPDGDGMSNFQEYAFGLDPTKGSSVSPISAPLEKSSGSFSYTRRATPASTGITYKVFTSTDLLTWTQDTGASEGVVTAVGDVQTVPVTLSPALLAAPALFLRVEATQP